MESSNVEREPSEEDLYENVTFIDEHPEAKKKVWLRRLNRDRQLGRAGVTGVTRVYQFPTVTEIPRIHPDYQPDDPA